MNLKEESVYRSWLNYSFYFTGDLGVWTFGKDHGKGFWLYVAPAVATMSKVVSLLVLGALGLVVSPHYPGGLAALLVSREQTSST